MSNQTHKRSPTESSINWKRSRTQAKFYVRCLELGRRLRYFRHSLHAKRQAKWTNKKCMNDVTSSAVERATDMVSSVGSSRTDLWDVGGLDAQTVLRSWALTIGDAAEPPACYSLRHQHSNAMLRHSCQRPLSVSFRTFMNADYKH